MNVVSIEPCNNLFLRAFPQAFRDKSPINELRGYYPRSIPVSATGNKMLL